jgi:hypothetical protein
MKTKPLPIALYAALIGLLLLPWVQERTGILRERPLAGVEDKTDSVALTWASWKEGKFQENYAVRMYKWMGLRPSMVRLRNQLDYSLFGEHYRSVLIGRDHELFGRGSLETMQGRDYVGEAALQYHCQNTALAQARLAAMGKALLVVLTPSKLQLMPDFVEGEAAAFAPQSNYPAFTRGLRAAGVRFLDLAPALQGWMRAEPHRVFPRTGTHWTDYGAYLGFGAILDTLEAMTGKPIVRPRLLSVTTSTEMRGTDADAGDLLNLICDLPPAPVGYPTLGYDTAGRVRPRAMVVGDSFWWEVYNQGLHAHCFAPGSVYAYYNYEVFSDAWQGARIVSEFDLRTLVDGLDVLIVCINSDNLHRYPFGIVDQVLQL